MPDRPAATPSQDPPSLIPPSLDPPGIRADGAPSEPPLAATPRVPPRWFVRGAWVVHRALYRITGGRLGLRTPAPGAFGMLRLHTVGRRSGEPRVAILGYVEDGPNLVLLAMNGWAEPHPAWWLNLEAHPDASVDLPGGRRRVRAREARGAERERLWAAWDAYSAGPSMEEYARLRARRTPVIVLEPSAR